MKQTFSAIILAVLFFSASAWMHDIYAIEDPLKVPNNKIGIHILFPYELEEAAKLVNSAGGDYGYVTIPIQSVDKDLEKWQSFLDDAKRLHLIPIVRLATEPDPKNTAVWRKPTDYDTVDFANFLHSLRWPYKNRYIIVYNEVNRSDEWGGNLNPREYAQILNYAVTVFKSKSPDYFIISAGLDNAAPDKLNEYMNQYVYMRQMNYAVPGIFNQVDGLASHSYPNPGFSQHPNVNTAMSINSFQYEQTLARSLSQKELPTFITETGWSTEAVPDTTVAGYYVHALTSVWANKNIVAVTPFLLQGGSGPFQKFSLFGTGGAVSQQYSAIKNFPKVKGSPTMQSVLSATDIKKAQPTPPERNFSDRKVKNHKTSISPQLKNMFKWLLRVE